MRISMRYFGRTVFLAVLLAVETLVFRFTYITLIIGLLIGPACMMLTVSGFSMFFFREIEKEGGVIRQTDNEDILNDVQDSDIKEEQNEIKK